MRTKKWLAILSIVLLVFALFPVGTSFAKNTDEESSSTAANSGSSGKYSSKDEVIYGNLDANGSIKNMYVVNTFHITEKGEIVDYGDYTTIRNLTDLSDIERTDNEVRFQAEDKEFYYQGELGNEPLPWDISITYLLDGEKVRADELAGKSGNLEIQLKTSANEDVDPLFFENYLLQISLTLDPLIFSNIQAPEGTEANEGKNKQISFMVLPDQEEELILTANVTDLEMDPIDIAAIPANIAIDEPDIGNMTGDMESLSDAIREINNGVADLSNGVSELNEGADSLNSGSTEYLNGINELNQSSNDLTNGSKEIQLALQEISGALQGSADVPDMGDINELPQGLREMAKGLRESAGGLGTLRENYNKAHDALAKSIKDIPDANISDKQIAELYQSGADPEVIDQLVKTYTAALTVKGTYNETKEGFQAVSATLEQVTAPLKEMATQLDAIADGMETSMKDLEQLDALTQLQNGLSTLSSEYNTFHEGLVSYTSGVNELATSYQELDNGIAELTNGTSSLESGVNELHEGTEELHAETNDLPADMQDKIDELMEEFENSDFEPASFVSDKNEKIDVVQFVLQTESIEIEEPEETTETEEEEKGLWDRFLDLFK